MILPSIVRALEPLSTASRCETALPAATAISAIERFKAEERHGTTECEQDCYGIRSNASDGQNPACEHQERNSGNKRGGDEEIDHVATPLVFGEMPSDAHCSRTNETFESTEQEQRQRCLTCIPITGRERGVQAMHVLQVFLISLPLPVFYLAFIFAYSAG
jgi:hypothetical protein